jgi:endonuclease/exonuclease/phosphatase (EEP) superfamily protein YafD
VARRALLGIGAVVLAVTLAGFVGDRLWPTELAASVRLQLLVLALVVTVTALAVRAPVAAAIAAAAVVANAVVIAPLFDGVESRPTGTDRLSVAHVNMQHRALDDGELARALRERRPDLLFLLDPPAGWVRGHATFAGYRVLGDGSQKVSAAVLAREAPPRVGRPFVEGLPGSALVVETTLEGGPVWILAMHAQAPTTPHLLAKRNRSLRAAGRLAGGREGARVVLGDLNSTPWSDAIERLEDEGRLVSSARGRGIQASWPAVLGPAGVAIDHLLHSPELAVVERELGPTLGSTHRSLWVTLARGAS